MSIYRIAVAFSGLACLWVPSADAAGNGEVTVWSWFISSTREKSIKAFEEKNPGLKVKYTYYN